MKPVLLVTGASRGIGAATALLAAKQGWAVAVNFSQNAAAAEAVVKQIKAESGQAVSIQADVGDEAAQGCDLVSAERRRAEHRVVGQENEPFNLDVHASPVESGFGEVLAER